ncbi:MAG: 50S ribosomal protein L10, partial [Elusimicrobiota bacterium]|nr:50S ribosomal protein L10 [Elusimicrobiota bacterium]
MNLTKEQKKERSLSLSKEIKQSAGIFFTAYQGLKFQDIAGLRAQLSGANCKFRVERNSILQFALKDAGVEGYDEALLKGPTAVAILKENGDVAMSAKSLADFAKTN